MQKKWNYNNNSFKWPSLLEVYSKNEKRKDRQFLNAK